MKTKLQTKVDKVMRKIAVAQRATAEGDLHRSLALLKAVLRELESVLSEVEPAKRPAARSSKKAPRPPL